MVKAMNCGIVVTEVELHLRYDLHFQTYTIRKGMNLHIPLPAMG